jgi:hypothetical protein
MKKGDIVVRVDDLAWRARVIGVSSNVSIVWLTGPLKGREALVAKQFLRKAPN